MERIFNDLTFKVQQLTDEELINIANNRDNHSIDYVQAVVGEMKNRSLAEEQNDGELLEMVLDEADYQDGFIADKGVDEKDTSKVYFATFWQRTAAHIIDIILLVIPNQIFIAGARVTDIWAIYLIGFCVGLSYYTLMEGSDFQGTFGKQIMGIKVIHKNGTQATHEMAAKRYIGMQFSFLVLGVGILAVLFDKNNQGWHDAFADCFVVKKTKGKITEALDAELPE